MEKTRDLFKKIRDTKGTFHAPQSCLTLCDSMDFSMLGFPSLSFTITRSLLKLMSMESVMPSNNLIL